MRLNDEVIEHLESLGYSVRHMENVVDFVKWRYSFPPDLRLPPSYEKRLDLLHRLVRKSGIGYPIQAYSKGTNELIDVYIRSRGRWVTINRSNPDYAFDVIDIMHNYALITDSLPFNIVGLLVAAKMCQERNISYCFTIVEGEYQDIMRGRVWSDPDHRLIWQILLERRDLVILECADGLVIHPPRHQLLDKNETHYSQLVKDLALLPRLKADDISVIANQMMTADTKYARSLNTNLTLRSWCLSKGARWVSNDGAGLYGLEASLSSEAVQYYFADPLTFREASDSVARK